MANERSVDRLVIRRARQEWFKYFPAKRQVPMGQPEPCQGSCQSQRAINIVLCEPAKCRTQIGMLEPYPGTPVRLVLAALVRFRLFGQAEKVVGMAMLGRRCFAAHLQLLQTELADRLEHRKPWLDFVLLDWRDETRLDESRQDVEH